MNLNKKTRNKLLIQENIFISNKNKYEQLFIAQNQKYINSKGAHVPFRWRTFFDDGEAAANPSANALNTAENADGGKSEFCIMWFREHINRKKVSIVL